MTKTEIAPHECRILVQLEGQNLTIQAKMFALTINGIDLKL
jgi:hypothetical protein